MKNRIIIGSRKSRLAMWQSNAVKESIERNFPGTKVIIEPIITKGDKILDKALSKIGDKGLFTEELEQGLLNEEIDIAVHSLKDLPIDLPKELCISSYSSREDPRDCLVSDKYSSLAELPKGAIVGTSSLRRQSQLLYMRPDIKIVDIRGNVETRIRKQKEEGMSAIIMATAGLKRLGLEAHIVQILPVTEMIPAPRQGIIAVESKRSRADLHEVLEGINNREVGLVAEAERALLHRFGGGCQVPIGALATLNNNNIELCAYVGSLDGKRVIRESLIGTQDEPEALGLRLAEKMLKMGADKIIETSRSW